MSSNSSNSSTSFDYFSNPDVRNTWCQTGPYQIMARNHATNLYPRQIRAPIHPLQMKLVDAFENMVLNKHHGKNGVVLEEAILGHLIANYVDGKEGYHALNDIFHWLKRNDCLEKSSNKKEMNRALHGLVIQKLLARRMEHDNTPSFACMIGCDGHGIDPDIHYVYPITHKKSGDETARDMLSQMLQSSHSSQSGKDLPVSTEDEQEDLDDHEDQYDLSGLNASMFMSATQPNVELVNKWLGHIRKLVQGLKRRTKFDVNTITVSVTYIHGQYYRDEIRASQEKLIQLLQKCGWKNTVIGPTHPYMDGMEFEITMSYK